MKIKKASPGLDQRNRLGSMLGDGFVVEDFDASRPLAAQVADADVLLIRDVPITRDVIDAAAKVRLIQRPGDHLPRIIDLAHARSKGIPVSRFPSKVQGSPARDVAEHAFYLLLALAKQQWLARASVKARKAGMPKTMSVHGKTLGLVGLGNTGEALARLAVPFGLRVIAVKRSACVAFTAASAGGSAMTCGETCIVSRASSTLCVVISSSLRRGRPAPPGQRP